jgi:hypothetical protein
MRFAIRFLRYRGRILPWREVMNQDPRTGDLRIEECLDAELHRYVRTACLFDVNSVIYSDARPKLLDVRLMAMSPQAFTLTGFERVAGVEYAQSWLVANCARNRVDERDKPEPGQLLSFVPEKTHVRNDRSQGAADVARCRKLGE